MEIFDVPSPLLSGNFVTSAGRERFRLKLVEGFTKVTGMSALAGRLARTDPELDAQIKAGGGGAG